ncbi:E3 ubiquitin protein ligase UPL3 [Tanacetum coccineum]
MFAGRCTNGSALRVALSTATNMCKNLPSDAADFVMVVVPLLTSLLQYHDAKHASVLLNRIVEAFASSPDGLDEICIHGLVTQAALLISTSIWKWAGVSPTLTTSTYTSLIRLISTCTGLVATMSVSPALSRPPEH